MGHAFPFGRTMEEFESSDEYIFLKNMEKTDLPTIVLAHMPDTFIFNGAIGVINYWVQNEFTESVDEISTIIEELSYNGIKSYLYNEKKKD